MTTVGATSVRVTTVRVLNKKMKQIDLQLFSDDICFNNRFFKARPPPHYSTKKLELFNIAKIFFLILLYFKFSACTQYFPKLMVRTCSHSAFVIMNEFGGCAWLYPVLNI